MPENRGRRSCLSDAISLELCVGRLADVDIYVRMAEWKNDGTGTAVDDDVVDDDDDDVKHCVCMYDRSTATLHMFECGEGERERERERDAHRELLTCNKGWQYFQSNVLDF